MNARCLLLLMAGIHLTGVVRAELPERRAVELEGQVVCLVEEVHRVYGHGGKVRHPCVLGFKDFSGNYHTLRRTLLSEAFFIDARLKTKILRVNGTVPRGRQLLDVTLIRSVKDGVLHDLYYWCDICAIKSVAPEECMCCQEPVVLREEPAR